MKLVGHNDGLVDAWTPVHFAVGAVFGALGIPRLLSVGLLTAFDLIERPVFGTRKETLVNQVGDVAFGYLGYIMFLKKSRTARPTPGILPGGDPSAGAGG